jgi:SAM-dependent methyltransferase
VGDPVVQAAYDTVAEDYAELLRDELDRKPLDRALLRTFAEAVAAGGGGRVADVGCGPGRITAHLHDLGRDAFGVDLSPAMIAVARRTHPHLRFEVGSMTGLDLPDGGLAGVVAWYSIIHFPPERLPGVLAELLRVVAPGGYLLLAFQAGDERVRLARAYGHEIALDAYRLPPDRIVSLVEAAGATLEARLVRAAGAREKTPQAFLLARKDQDVPCPAAEVAPAGP